MPAATIRSIEARQGRLANDWMNVCLVDSIEPAIAFHSTNREIWEAVGQCMKFRSHKLLINTSIEQVGVTDFVLFIGFEHRTNNDLLAA